MSGEPRQQRPEVVVPQKQMPARTVVTVTCDCPCHDGENVFHVVSCCGSVLSFPLWKPEAHVTPGRFDPAAQGTTDSVGSG
jgi:hypothetical protein